MERGAHFTVSSCLATGNQVAQGPGQVYLAGEEEGKGAKTGCSGTPGIHRGILALGPVLCWEKKGRNQVISGGREDSTGQRILES